VGSVRKRLFFALVLGFTIWVLASLILLPPLIVATSPNPVDEDPSSRGLAFENILINGEDLTLQGWWIPAANPIAELIFVHGAGSNRVSRYIGSLDFYRTLHQLGVSIVTIDLRNHGNSPMTDGQLRMGSVEWQDLIHSARWLDAHQTQQLPRFALGASMGGSIVIRALREGLRVDGAILLDPQLDIYDSLVEGAEVSTGLPASLFSLAAQVAIWRYDLPADENAPLTLASTLRIPILLIQDWDDPVTRSPFAQSLAQANPQVLLARVPAIPPNAACLEYKGAWGSHVAAHPCHPEWTRATIERFIRTVSAAL